MRTSTTRIQKKLCALCVLCGLTLRTFRALTPEREFQCFGFELRLTCGLFKYVGRDFHLDVHQLSALSADRVVMPMRHPVITARTVAERDLGNMSGVFQISKTVVNRRETDRRQQTLRRRKNLIRRQMLVRIADRLQYNLALLRQSQFFSTCFHYSLQRVAELCL